MSEQRKQQRSNVHENSSGVASAASKQAAVVQDLHVAITHDWLIGGGAEQVILHLHKMFPEAPIYTSYCSPSWRAKLDGKVVTGYLQQWPFSKLRKYLPVLRAWWFGRLDLTGYDLVISSSGNGEAKGIKTPASTTHICYCHTPTHFYWRHYDHYMQHPGFGLFDPVARIGLKLLVGPLRRYDLRSAKKPDYFIANSAHIQADIESYYGRDSVVIHPPVDVERFGRAPDGKRQGFVTMGRQATYKRTDIIVQACSELNLPLRVIGRGPDHNKLVAMAGPSVEFLTAVTDEEMPQQLASAEAFLFAAYEDFGVAPVEAMAAGTPVISYRAGGALDYVIPGKTGEFFDDQSVESLKQALAAFKPTSFDSQTIKQHAAQFSADNFRQQIQTFIEENAR